MLKKLIQAVIIGLVTAALVLFLLPKVNQNSAPQVMSFKDAVRVAAPAVVNVYNRAFSSSSSDNQLQVTNLGSGVIMSKDGYILTNRHVIQNADQIVVALQNGQIFDASLIGADNLTDLAVLKIQSDNLPTIPQAKNVRAKLHVGDIALAIGNPYNLGQSVSQGIISALGRNVSGDSLGRQNFIQTDASINRGNSGGALINSLGELIGINTLSIGKSANEMAEGLNFAIPIELAENVMHKIIRDGRVIRGYFGVQSDILFNNGQGETEKGILITSVMPSSPADLAGIQAGDLIVKVDNIEVRSPAHMMELVANTKPNEQIKVTLLRLNKTLELTVTIGEYPNNN